MDPQSREPDFGTGPVQTMLNGIVWVGRAAAWLIVPILALVLIGVTLSMLKVGTIFEWEQDVFLFGSKLTLASLGDLQWHLFGFMLMLTMAGALVTNNHVRVDFLRQHMSPRLKRAVDLIGHILFLLPLSAVVVWHGYDFTVRSFSMGEGSNYDGLYDRFFLKSSIPIGFALLALAGLGLAGMRLRELLRGDTSEFD
jgi:TRAP-type mannitol/chloroaromatic compound transport system permease small subunit